jgi:tryptophan 2,3-dioxygenase
MSTELPPRSGVLPLSYGEYLRIPQLTGLQHPQSSPPHHDELLFIVIHQTYELWFKLLLHELDAVVANLQAAARNPGSRDEVYEAARLLRRCTEIARVLVLHEPTPKTHVALERRLREPSLRDVFFDALAALGVMPQVGERAGEEDKFQARARAIVTLYRDEKGHRDWIDVCERLTEFDELIVSWRLRHIQMVERTIGLRMGTGGSSGASYLKGTIDKKFFPELWEARSLMSEGNG